MPRSIGKVTISFGMISIPTKIYNSGDSSSRIGFNLMSPKGNRLKQQYVDPEDGNRVIPHAEQQKGYEFAKGQYICFTQAEIKAIQEPRDPVVVITSFVPDRIPPEHLDKVYYMAPEKGAERAYELLRQALLKTGRVGITKHCSHGKQHLAMVKGSEHGLMLQHLLFSDEVNSFSDVHKPGPVKILPAELAMAEQLIGMAASDDVDLAQHTDAVKQRLEAAIEARIAGVAIPAQASDEGPDATQDLMAALQASIAKVA